jgi:DNA-binding HxlR family transcriptional regulator
VEHHEHGFCPVYGAIDLLQEKWTLHIVRALLSGAKGFNELRREVGNCNPSTLSERLETLVQANVLAKTIHSTMPPRTSYQLTEAGVALNSVIDAIKTWSLEHLLTPVPRKHDDKTAVAHDVAAD